MIRTQRVGERIQYMYPGVRANAPRSAAAGAPGWWLSGGISAANCVAAYQAKGAASYAASLVNLANPGTYDAVAPGDAPTWATNLGWGNDWSVTKYLTTGIDPSQGYSAIVRYSSNTKSGLIFIYGSYSGVNRFYFIPDWSGVRYGYGSATAVLPSASEGVFAITPSGGYRNGVFDTAVGTITLNPGIVFIGVANASGAATGACDAYIQALAIYDTDISTFAAALTTAMAAL